MMAVVLHGTAMSRGELQERRVTLAEGSAAFPGQHVRACTDPGFLLLCQRVHSLFPATEAGFFHQPSASVLTPPLACTAQYSQQNICCVVVKDLISYSKETTPIAQGRGEHGKHREVLGELRVWLLQTLSII